MDATCLPRVTILQSYPVFPTLAVQCDSQCDYLDYSGSFLMCTYALYNNIVRVLLRKLDCALFTQVYYNIVSRLVLFKHADKVPGMCITRCINVCFMCCWGK